MQTTDTPSLDKLKVNERQRHVDEYMERALGRFMRLCKAHVMFHCFFALVIGIECALFSLFFSFWSHSFMLAFPLAAFILTLFIYIVLVATFQTKKTEQFWRLKKSYLDACGKTSRHLGVSEHHFSQARCAERLVALLQHQEHHFYPLLKTPLTPKLSCFLHWRDVLRMKEVLLLSAIDHYIQLVPDKPTDIELHTHLANAFVSLSHLYFEPSQRLRKGELHYSEKSTFAGELKDKFDKASKSAVEEFTILDTYAPNDAWVHSQLAACYHHLKMPQEEIAAYEKILRLCPEDLDSSYRLGVLYFQEGFNAKALEIYQHLKRMSYPKANDLLKFYKSSLRKLLANSSSLSL